MPSDSIKSQYIEGLELLSCAPTDKQKTHSTPLLFIHGACAGAWCWADHYLPWFAEQGWDAYALSLRGHGQSYGRESLDKWGIRDFVDDVAQIIDWLDTPPILIGHSMGGFVLQNYLHSYDTPIPASILMCSVPPQGLLSAQLLYLPFTYPLMNLDLYKAAYGSKVSIETIERTLFSQPVSQEILQRFVLLQQPESKQALWDISKLNLSGFSKQSVHGPTLVLGTEQDQLIPSFLIKNTAKTLNAEIHIFEQMGHCITHEKDWAQVTLKINQWLNSVTPA